MGPRRRDVQDRDPGRARATASRPLHFRDAYLAQAIDAGLVEMTIPSKPSSRLDRYRLTAAGVSWRVTNDSAEEE